MTDAGYSVDGLDIDIDGITDRGLVRPSNEDSFVVLQDAALPNHYLAVAGVFDGVGGQPHGARASSTAASCLAQFAGDSSLSPLVSRRTSKDELDELMQQLHNGLMLDGVQDPALQGMATTATVALVTKDSPVTLWIAHVGDSPAFRLRDGQLQKLTREDSVVGNMVRKGLVTQEDAGRHPQRNVITQALGSHKGIRPHVAAHAVEPRDCFMLCTDGLTNMVGEDTIVPILESESSTTACKQLIEAANSAGGIDNVTMVVMKFVR